MSQYPISHSSVQPIINFSAEDWRKIEDQGRLRLSYRDRDKIKKVARHFVLMRSAEANVIGLAKIQEPLRRIKQSARSIIKVLQATDFSSASGQAALLLGKARLGPRYTLSQVNPAYQTCADLVRAADQALAQLDAKAAIASPGPKHGGSLAEFILALRPIFERRSGRRVTIGTVRRGGTEERRSPFSDFAHAIYSVLCRDERNGLPRKQASTFGETVRRALCGARSTN
jgi:hypothetical protein